MRSLCKKLKVLFFITFFVSTITLQANDFPEIPTAVEMFAPLPQTGKDADGNVIAVWKEFDDKKHTTIKSAVLTKENVWLPTVEVSNSPENYFKDDPHIAVDASGNAVAVWCEYQATELMIPPRDSVVKASFYSEGKWSLPKIISLEGEVGFFPQIAVNDSGFGIIAWIKFLDNKGTVQALTFNANGFSSSPVDISTSDSNIISSQVAIDNEGNALVIMQDHISKMIQSTSLPVGGTWTVPTSISPVTNWPILDMTKEGLALLIWENFDGNQYVLQSSTMQFGSAWSTPIEITRTDKSTEMYNAALNLVKSPGMGLVVWSERIEYFSAVSIIFYTSFLTEFGWTPAEAITSTMLNPYSAFPLGERSMSPVVAYDHTGNSYIVWYFENDFVTKSIVGGFYDSLGHAFNRVSLTNPFEACDLPQIIIRNTDEAVVLWQNKTHNKVQSAIWRPLGKTIELQ